MRITGSESPFALRERELLRLSKFGLARDGDLKIGRAVALAAAVAWVPLLLLSLLNGTAFGDDVRIPFLADYVPHGRYLFALPALLLMDLLVERHTSFAIAHLRDADLIATADQDRFQQTVMAAARGWRSPAVRVVFVAATYGMAIVALMWEREYRPSSWVVDDGSLTAAGAWNIFVSAAMTRLLVLRAVWKLAVWIWLLARVSRLRLQLDPLHPDGRCGLRFLGDAQLSFSPLIAAGGIQVGCVIANSVRFQGAQLANFRLLTAAFVTLSVILLLGPLIVFAREARWAHLRELHAFGIWSSFAARYMSRRMQQSRREGLKEELGSSEISSLTDASTLFDRLRAAKPVPIDVRQIVIVALAAIVPAAAPLLTLLPLREVLQRLLKMLM